MIRCHSPWQPLVAAWQHDTCVSETRLRLHRGGGGGNCRLVSTQINCLRFIIRFCPLCIGSINCIKPSLRLLETLVPVNDKDNKAGSARIKKKKKKVGWGGLFCFYLTCWGKRPRMLDRRSRGRQVRCARIILWVSGDLIWAVGKKKKHKMENKWHFTVST